MLIKNLLFTIILIFTQNVSAKIAIAIVDTGVNDEHNVIPWCEGQKVLHDNSLLLHGTNIAGLVAKYALGADYCVHNVRWEYKQGDSLNLERAINALEAAISLKPNVILLAMVGTVRSEREARAIKGFLDKGGIVVAAAGNDSLNLDIDKVYPASYDKRILVIGNRAPSSNFGSIVDCIEDGNEVKGLIGPALSGTSQASAIAAGKAVKALHDKKPFMCYRR